VTSFPQPHADAAELISRTVGAFISHVHLDPMFSVELFRLAPRADGGPDVQPVD
jgi:hypothetical protein